MSGSLNKVQIIGNLGKDPEVRIMPNGSKVCNLTVATSTSWKDRDSGERKERTEWHRVVIFNDHLSDVARQYLTKGSKVYLEGQLETRKWTDQSGADKYQTEIVLRSYNGQLTLLDKKNADQPQTHDQQTGEVSAPQQGYGAASQGAYDEEIPF